MYYDRNFFLPSGKLAQLEGYEYREQQQKMADQVLDILINGHIGLIEAGTGTGKSLAYLYPAVCFAVSKGEKVVISTNTINLQEQLLDKDIPVLKKLGLQFKAAVVKGWSNYPCWLRLKDLQEQLQDEADAETMLQMEELLEKESIAEITKLFDSLSADIKEQIQAESDLCIRGKCSFFNQCPVFINRRLAETADIVIVNHHLLLADIAVRQAVGWEENAVLPLYYHLVVDEAHHIEDIATEYFGVQLSLLRIRRLLGFLNRPYGKNRGVLASLRQKLSRNPSEENDDILSVLDWQMLPQLRIVDEAAVKYFAALEKEFFKESEDSETVLISYCGLEREPLLESYDRFFSALVTLKTQLENLVHLLDPDEGDKLMPYLKRFESVITDLEFLKEANDRSCVYWLKKQSKQFGCVLQAAPIYVGEQLRENLLFQVKSAIFTSATLTVNQEFTFFCNSIGIDQNENWDLNTAIFASPFDYQKQVFLAVAKDMPSPDRSEFTEVLVDHLEPLLAVTQGRAFILFTSYAMLRKTAQLVRERGLDQEYNFLVQGEMPRTEMLNRFRGELKTVLLGTDSFWEGVDVAGEALSTVIITKLPFKVPTEPIAAARSEQLRQSGSNPFLEYFLPQAVLKFRQGCGRLIRTKTDRGMILICDKRIMERNYGKFFIKSLPACSIHYDKLEAIEQEVRSWF